MPLRYRSIALPLRRTSASSWPAPRLAAEDAFVIESQGVQAVPKRANAPFLVAVLDQQVREVAHALDRPRLDELLLGQ